MWGIRPKEGTNFAGYLNSVVHRQSLQSLYVKNPIVEFALGAFVSVDTLPLPKHLS